MVAGSIGEGEPASLSLLSRPSIAAGINLDILLDLAAFTVGWQRRWTVRRRCHFPGLELFAKKLADIDIDTQRKSLQAKLQFDLVQEVSRLDGGYASTVFTGIDPNLAKTILAELRSRLASLV